MSSIPGALALVAAVTALPAHAVNKCTMPDGRVVYSDAPCAADTKQAQRVSAAPIIAPMAPQPTRPPGQQGAMHAAEQPALQIPPPKRVQFSGLPESDLSWSAGTLDKIRMQGRDCDWALRVDKTKMQSCVDFLARMQPGGEVDQIRDRVLLALRQDPGLARRSKRDLDKIELYQDEALGFQAKAMANLNRQGR